MAVAGDSVGANMAIALTLLAKQRGGVSFVQQVLFYPVTNSAFDTPQLRPVRRGLRPHQDGNAVVLEPVHD